MVAQGGMRRTLPLTRSSRPRRGFCGSSSLTPLWYGQATVRFFGLVLPPFFHAFRWCIWAVSAGWWHPSHGQVGPAPGK